MERKQPKPPVTIIQPASALGRDLIVLIKEGNLFSKVIAEVNNYFYVDWNKIQSMCTPQPASGAAQPASGAAQPASGAAQPAPTGVVFLNAAVKIDHSVCDWNVIYTRLHDATKPDRVIQPSDLLVVDMDGVSTWCNDPSFTVNQLTGKDLKSFQDKIHNIATVWECGTSHPAFNPASGATAAGATATGPTAAGPTAAGPTATGPTASGPTATGPTASGPTASGPTAAGPTAAGSIIPPANNVVPISLTTGKGIKDLLRLIGTTNVPVVPLASTIVNLQLEDHFRRLPKQRGTGPFKEDPLVHWVILCHAYFSKFTDNESANSKLRWIAVSRDALCNAVDVLLATKKPFYLREAARFICVFNLLTTHLKFYDDLVQSPSTVKIEDLKIFEALTDDKPLPSRIVDAVLRHMLPSNDLDTAINTRDVPGVIKIYQLYPALVVEYFAAARSQQSVDLSNTVEYANEYANVQTFQSLYSVDPGFHISERNLAYDRWIAKFSAASGASIQTVEVSYFLNALHLWEFFQKMVVPPTDFSVNSVSTWLADVLQTSAPALMSLVLSRLKEFRKQDYDSLPTLEEEKKKKKEKKNPKDADDWAKRWLTIETNHRAAFSTVH